MDSCYVDLDFSLIIAILLSIRIEAIDVPAALSLCKSFNRNARTTSDVVRKQYEETDRQVDQYLESYSNDALPKIAYRTKHKCPSTSVIGQPYAWSLTSRLTLFLS